MTATRDRRRHEAALAAATARLGDDELEVILVIATRLWDGQRRYGRFDLDRDRRDFGREALEEVVDALVYSGVALVRRRRRQSVRRQGHGEGTRA